MTLLFTPADVIAKVEAEASFYRNLEASYAGEYDQPEERNPEANAAEMHVTQDEAFEIADAAWERANEGKWDNYVPDEINN